MLFYFCRRSYSCICVCVYMYICISDFHYSVPDYLEARPLVSWHRHLVYLTQVKYLYLLLYEYIRSTLRRGFFYMIPTSQNELIGIVTKHTIQIWLKSKMSFYFCRRSYSCIAYVYICMCNILMKQWRLIVQLKTIFGVTKGYGMRYLLCFAIDNLQNRSTTPHFAVFSKI